MKMVTCSSIVAIALSAIVHDQMNSHEINAQFTPLPPEPGRLCHSRCAHCGEQVDRKSLIRKRKHLSVCESYQQLAISNPFANQNGKRPLVREPVSRKDAIEKQITLAIGASGHAMTSWFQTYAPETVDVIRKNYDPCFQGVNRHKVAKWVPVVEQELEAQVMNVMRPEIWLNITTDGFESRNGDRIVNFAVSTTKGTSFSIKNITTGDLTQSASYLVARFVEAVTKVTGGDLTRVNSIATDTCSAMRAFHSELKSHSDLSHVLISLCDSHGIQLLIKDIVDSGTNGPVEHYKVLLNQAQQISLQVRHSPKSYAHIKEVIRASKSQVGLRKFVVAVITRWGSQYAVVDALIENRRALI